MVEVFAICVKQDKRNDYIYILSLEEIDYLFTNYSKEQVLNMMRSADPVLKQTDPEQITIKQMINKKMVGGPFLQIVTNPTYLTFAIEPILLDPNKGDKMANVLKNNLEPFLDRNISDHFKKVIELLNKDKILFLTQFPTLSYSEQRVIRSILSKQEFVKNYLESNKPSLTRTKTMGEDVA